MRLWRELFDFNQTIQNLRLWQSHENAIVFCPTLFCCAPITTWLKSSSCVIGTHNLGQILDTEVVSSYQPNNKDKCVNLSSLSHTHISRTVMSPSRPRLRCKLTLATTQPSFILTTPSSSILPYPISNMEKLKNTSEGFGEFLVDFLNPLLTFIIF